MEKDTYMRRKVLEEFGIIWEKCTNRVVYGLVRTVRILYGLEELRDWSGSVKEGL